MASGQVPQGAPHGNPQPQQQSQQRPLQHQYQWRPTGPVYHDAHPNPSDVPPQRRRLPRAVIDTRPPEGTRQQEKPDDATSRKLLSEYVVVWLKVLKDVDDSGNPLPLSWGLCDWGESAKVPEREAASRVAQLTKMGPGIADKLHDSPVDLKRTIDQIREKIEDNDADKRYQYELVQMDYKYQDVAAAPPKAEAQGSSSTQKSQRKDKSKIKDKERGAKKAPEKRKEAGMRWIYGVQDSKSRAKGKEKEKQKGDEGKKGKKGKEENKNNGNDKSKGEDKKNAKPIGDPESATLYFLRSPGRHENAVFMLEQLNESKARTPGNGSSSQQRMQAPPLQHPWNQYAASSQQHPGMQAHAQHRQQDPPQIPTSQAEWIRQRMADAQIPIRPHQQGASQGQFGRANQQIPVTQQPAQMQPGEQTRHYQHQGAAAGQQGPAPGVQQPQGQAQRQAYQMPDAPRVPPPPPVQPSIPVQNRGAPAEAGHPDPPTQRPSFEDDRDGRSRHRDGHHTGQRRPSTLRNRHHRHGSEGRDFIWSSESMGSREDFDDDDEDGIFTDASSNESFTSTYLSYMEAAKEKTDIERERQRSGARHVEDYFWPRGQRSSPSDPGRGSRHERHPSLSRRRGHTPVRPDADHGERRYRR